MRKIFLFLVVSALANLVATPCRADEAQKIIDQYLKAVGGAKIVSHLQTLSIDGSIAATGDEVPGTYTFKVKQPNRIYTELRSNGKTVIESYNGKSAWHQNPEGELSTFLGREAVEMEAAAQYYNARLQALGKRKVGVTYKGATQVRGIPAYELQLTYPTGVQWQVLFDAKTHLILQEKAQIAGIPREMDYDDYRRVAGLKVPYKMELHRGNEAYTVNVTRAAVNETVGERVFDFPIKSQVKLPDLKKLFDQVDANQKEIDKVKENYAGTRMEEETEYDKSGKPTKKEVKEFSFFYLDGQEVSTLTKKDGKPLSDEEQKKENEKTQKEIGEIQKREKKKEAKEEKAKEQGKEEKDKDDPGIEVFLRSSQFVNPRRERFRGQDVLVFDFEPNPEFKPKTMAEKLIRDLAGVIWVDEKANDVARLEAYFVGDFHLAGGLLASVERGTSFVFEQAYLNNEVWLPTYFEAHIGARVLLVKGFKMNVAMRYSDYKRFNVETLNSIGKPKETGTAANPAGASPTTPQ
jgi:outer membrane lipoprotein-sorting protein